MASTHGNPRDRSATSVPRHSREVRHVQLAGSPRASKRAGLSAQPSAQKVPAPESPKITQVGAPSASLSGAISTPKKIERVRSVQKKSSVHKRGAHSAPLEKRAPAHSAELERPARSHERGASGQSAEDAAYERLKRKDGGSHARGYSSEPPDIDAKVREASRKKRRRRKILVGTLVGVLVACLVGAGAAFAYIYSINKNLQNRVDDALLSVLSPVDTPTDPFYVLLLGTDGSAEREAEDGLDESSYRSDSMMLARVDPQNKKAALISIPRDTLVDIPGHGKQKINAALALGGPSLAVQTVSKLAGIPITHYAEVNFDGFAAVVDALGGIEVDVPIPIDDDEAGGHLDAGVQTLYGWDALILCRSRHTYDDYGAGDLYRAANQRLVLSAIAQKMLSVDPFNLSNSVSSLSQYVTTDLDVASIIGIAQSMRGIDATEDIYTAVAPTTSEYKDGAWYEILDQTAWKNMIKRMDSGLPPVATDEVDLSTGTILSSAGSKSEGDAYKVNKATTIRLRNGNGADGVCDEALKLLQDMGYVNINTGNADTFDYPETIVVYKKDAQASEANAIARVLGGKAVKDDGSYLFESSYLIVIGADWQTP